MVRGCNTVACRQAAERRRTDAVRAAALGAGAVCAPAHLHEPASNQLQYSFCVFNAAPTDTGTTPSSTASTSSATSSCPTSTTSSLSRASAAPAPVPSISPSSSLPPPPLPLPSVYKQRLLSLKSLVLVMFTRDSMARLPQLNAPSPYQKQRPFSLPKPTPALTAAAGAAARELAL